MRCPACGKQLPEDPYFCAYCGAVIHPTPAPLPRVAVSFGAAGLALVGTLAALPAGLGFWLLSGQLVLMGWTQRLLLGAMVALLSGTFGAGLQGQLSWPLDAHPPRATAHQLTFAYGIGGALTIAIGAALIGAVVLPLGWGLGLPTFPALLTGAASGLVGVEFALPPALLAGAVAGAVLGRLARHWPRPGAAWAAALAWWIAGSAGGGVVGAFVASRTNYPLPTGAYVGAILQSMLQCLLLPVATYLVRWSLVHLY